MIIINYSSFATSLYQFNFCVPSLQQTNCYCEIKMYIFAIALQIKKQRVFNLHQYTKIINYILFHIIQ